MAYDTKAVSCPHDAGDLYRSAVTSYITTENIVDNGDKSRLQSNSHPTGATAMATQDMIFGSRERNTYILGEGV